MISLFRPCLAPFLLAAIAVPALTGCVIDRKQECKDAEACDQALEEPFGDFDADDDAFGDLGNCWQTEDTAAPCVQACNDFVAEQLAEAQEDNKVGIIEACGG